MLIELVKVTPNGVLVFFTSYKALSSCYDAWRGGILYDLKQSKKVFYEGKNS